MIADQTIRAISVEAGRDPRTVRAVLAGRGSPNATAAVYNAMRRLGIVADGSPITVSDLATPGVRRMA